MNAKAVAIAEFIGVWFYEKFAWAYFYWFSCPGFIREFGSVSGYLLIFSIQLAYSIGMSIAYDQNGRDLVGIAKLKEDSGEKAAARIAAVRLFLGFKKTEASWFGKGVWKVIKLWVLAVEMSGWMGLLCFRKDGKKFPFFTEVLIMSSCISFATAWWSIYSFFFNRLVLPVWHWIVHPISM